MAEASVFEELSGGEPRDLDGNAGNFSTYRPIHPLAYPSGTYPQPAENGSGFHSSEDWFRDQVSVKRIHTGPTHERSLERDAARSVDALQFDSFLLVANDYNMLAVERGYFAAAV